MQEKITISIRRATISDIPSIQVLAEQLASHLHEVEKPLLTAQSMARFFCADDASMYCYVAVAEKNIIGVITWTLIYDLHNTCHSVFIADLCINKEVRGNKVGQALFEFVVSWGRQQKAKRISWDVWNQNMTAINFYKKQGAEPVTDVTGYQLFL